MTSIYFLDGLGSNEFFSKRLEDALAAVDLKLVYLPLPGHPGNLEWTGEHLDDLRRWFEKMTPQQPFIVMGFSLGADFAAYLAKENPNVKRVILLDGGFMDFNDYPIEQDLADTKDYLTSQTIPNLDEKVKEERAATPYWDNSLEAAIRMSYRQVGEHYELNLTEKNVLDLLKMRRMCLRTIATSNYKVPTLILLSDTPEEFYQYKMTLLNPIQSDTITVETLPKTSHQLYLEKPEMIAEEIVRFLKESKMSTT